MSLEDTMIHTVPSLSVTSWADKMWSSREMLDIVACMYILPHLFGLIYYTMSDPASMLLLIKTLFIVIWHASTAEHNSVLVKLICKVWHEINQWDKYGQYIIYDHWQKKSLILTYLTFSTMLMNVYDFWVFFQKKGASIYGWGTHLKLSFDRGLVGFSICHLGI